MSHIHESILKIRENLLPKGSSLYWHDEETVKKINNLVEALEELKPYEKKFFGYKTKSFFEWLERLLLRIKEDYEKGNIEELKNYITNDLDVALLKLAYWFEGIERLKSEREQFTKRYDLPILVYRVIYNFLEKQGLVQHVLRYLEMSEVEAYDKLAITKTGLSVLDAVRCAMDEKRTLCFLKAVAESVRPGSVVLEAGSGTGILSVMAAVCGAKKVYAVEYNPGIIALSKKTRDYFNTHPFFGRRNLLPEIEKILVQQNLIKAGTIDIWEGDAAKYMPPEKIDVLISENIYTGFFFEYQQQIINHLLSFLKHGGEVIPLEMDCSIELANTDLRSTKEMSMVVRDIKQINPFTLLSGPVTYDKSNFKVEGQLRINKKIGIPIKKTGYVNCVIISSNVNVSPGLTLHRNETDFLANDHLIFLAPDQCFEVHEGKTIDIQVDYDKSCNPKELRIRLIE